MKPLRVAFAGTPEFAKVALAAIAQSVHSICGVLTQPDRPSGRGMKLQPSPVKQLALANGWPVFQPASLKPLMHLKGMDAHAACELDDALKKTWACLAGLGDTPSCPVDVLVVAAYGLMLPQVVLDAPVHGCLNIHASLLPRWRGAAPIHRAIEAGDAETGVGIMRMEAGLDTGPVALQAITPILDADTTGTLHDRLADMGAQLIVQALDSLAQGHLQFEPQQEGGVLYAHKIQKSEANVDWSESALLLSRRLRAFDPSPGAFTAVGGNVVKCFGPSVISENDVFEEPGMVLSIGADGVAVACGQGILNIAVMQRAGGKRLPAAQTAQVLGLQVGYVFARTEQRPGA